MPLVYFSDEFGPFFFPKPTTANKEQEQIRNTGLLTHYQ